LHRRIVENILPVGLNLIEEFLDLDEIVIKIIQDLSYKPNAGKVLIE